VYVVVDAGATVVEVPETVAPFNVNEVCPETDHVSTLDSPWEMLVGLATKEDTTGGSGGVTTGVTVKAKIASPVPPVLAAPSKTLYDPATVGDPDIRPAALRESPVGSPVA
jgi:hypothetical protein